MANRQNKNKKSGLRQTLSNNKGKLAIGGTLSLIAGGALYSLYSNHSSSSSSSSKKSNDGDAGAVADDGTGATSGSSTSGDSSEDSSNTVKKTVVEEVPIDNYEDALKFANTEWNKCKRNNGRTLDVSVLGSTHWKTGEWCKVYLPSFDIDGYMYITRVSQTSDSGDWTTNLTLVDYPPGWGKEELKSDDDSEEEETDDSEEESSESDTTSS